MRCTVARPLPLLLAICCCSMPLLAQKPTPADVRLQGFELRKSLKDNSLVAALRPENIGPSIFSCRVTDVEANPEDPSKMYVAYASGGLWYSDNNGTTFQPVFDQEASMTIGDIAVDWQRGVLWVGTGESNSSRSSYAGTGIYRSADGGKTWEYRGLPESHHIGRIILHPSDPEVIWVAVLGHLYSPNPERGVYRSTDGGRNWKRTLFVNNTSGAIDICLDPQSPNTLYAATWERERQAWNFSGAGAGSGIWKSTDGGATWGLVSTPESGFPTGPNVGRIGLCAGAKDGQTVLYASVDNQNPKPKKDKAHEGITKDQLRSISAADFQKLPDEKLDDFLKDNGFPEKYSAKKIKDQVQKGKITPQTLVEFLEDANAKLFDVDYIGAEVYRSTDGGRSWTRSHAEPLDGIHFTYGYYFSNIRCLPDNPDQLYLLGFLIIKSEDGGQTWKSINGDNVHVDHHALWIDPAQPRHLINGNDGGLNISWDNGASWIKCNNPPVGQFYAIATDAAEPYRVYGGAQDNGVWSGPSNYKASSAWQQDGRYPYEELLGGDGMQIAVDTRDNATVYTGFQFGNYFRINKNNGRRKAISPKHELGERPLRFNWQTPIWLSVHQQDVLYLGAHRLYRSFNQGDDWAPISDDLTAGGRAGNVPYGTLSTIHESPLKFGLLYTGSDDGRIHVSRDGGDTWTRISDSLPQKNLWVSRVIASAHDKARVFVSLNGYRSDDFSAYLYMSDNYGKQWRRLGANLPAEPINVVREDPGNPNVLYVGTDHGLYVSLDRGESFQTLAPDFPAVAVHDLAVQAKAKELVIGTHGRSMFKVNIAAVQQLNAEVLAEAVHLFEIQKTKFSKNWGKKQPWREAKDPGLPVTFYAASVGKASWTVKTKDGLVVNNGEWDCVKGLNTFTFALDCQDALAKKYQKAFNDAQKDPKKPLELVKADNGKFYLQKGSFLFDIQKDNKTASQEFVID
ncbi:MAG: glycosyl hydrolase [Saprospiraceae bacterium]|nr:glycosyl hydrolase [Saprospiraceae bacterium]